MMPPTPTPEASGEPLSDDDLDSLIGCHELGEKQNREAGNDEFADEYRDTVILLRELQQRRAASLPAARDVAPPPRCACGGAYTYVWARDGFVCARCESFTADIGLRAEPARVPAAQGGDVATEAALRAMWDAGFKTCRDYTDNWAHCEGEQKERRVREALDAVAYRQDGVTPSAAWMAGATWALVAKWRQQACEAQSVVSALALGQCANELQAALDARLSPPQAGEPCSLEEGCPCSACAREARILAAGELKLTRYGRLAYEAGRKAAQGAPEASVDLETLARQTAARVRVLVTTLKFAGIDDAILAALQRARETGAKHG